MTKIKDEKEVKALFGYASAFGNFSEETAIEHKNLTAEQLSATIEGEETKLSLDDRRLKHLHDGRGKLKGKTREEYKLEKASRSTEEKRATFIANKYQIAKIMEIAYREATFVKDIYFEALQMYIDKYEKTHGEVIPSGKATTALK